jgi:hypothetical protein
MSDTPATLAALVAVAMNKCSSVIKATVDCTTVRVTLDNGEKFIINIEQHRDDYEDCT